MQITPVLDTVSLRVAYDMESGNVFMVAPGSRLLALGNTRTGELFHAQVLRPDEADPENLSMPEKFRQIARLQDTESLTYETVALQSLFTNLNAQASESDQVQVPTYLEAVLEAWKPRFDKSQPRLIELLVTAADACLAMRQGKASPLEAVKVLESLVAFVSAMPEDVLAMQMMVEGEEVEEKSSIILP